MWDVLMVLIRLKMLMMVISEVFLNRLMKVFMMLGIMMCRVCGRMMSDIICG